MPTEPLIPPHGGYRKLKSFQVAQLAYDVTVRFCDRYVERRSRTHDQMVQAARSGVQNIAEGSKASGTSKKMELKLTNVARASLEELRLDYEDFLRHRGLSLWSRDDPRRADLIARRCKSAEEVAAWVGEVHARERRGGQHGQHGHGGESETAPTHPEIAANSALTLIAVACALLDRQVAAQAAAFENEGGSPNGCTGSDRPDAARRVLGRPPRPLCPLRPILRKESADPPIGIDFSFQWLVSAILSRVGWSLLTMSLLMPVNGTVRPPSGHPRQTEDQCARPSA
jgi:four helix bundle suffix protein